MHNILINVFVAFVGIITVKLFVGDSRVDQEIVIKKFPHSDSSCITNEEQTLKFRPSVAALHNRLIKTCEIPLTNCSYILHVETCLARIFLTEMVRIGIEKVSY